MQLIFYANSFVKSQFPLDFFLQFLASLEI